MCGFAGTLEAIAGGADNSDVVLKMNQAISYRGPDDFGVWTDPASGVSLGHRRLAIVDLSAAGHQPMRSRGERYVLVFNGEIYNHLSMRQELTASGRPGDWRGTSDTETLLAGFETWGIAGTVEKAIGMFAFAVWDRQARVLTLGRDRLGEKPLYYGWQGQSFLFGSELKALKQHPSFEGQIDRGALALFMRHNAIPGGSCIYRGISKLQPGCLASVSLDKREPIVHTYWSVEQVVRRGQDRPFVGSPEAAVQQLDELLLSAVGQQMVADVPLGAFLSGGIDSSTIVALMQAQSSKPVRTFSIGFHEPGYNEAEHAKAVARHLGTEHTELYVTSTQAQDVIPNIPDIYDEPFADSSQIPTYLVSQLAKQHVTVSLSGDAGDELFAGYNRYLMTSRLWGRLSKLPRFMRKGIALGITTAPPSTWNSVVSPFARLRGTNFGDKLHKGADVLAAANIDDLYRRLISHWQDPAQVVIGAEEPDTLLTTNRLPSLNNGIERMMALDTMTYLPDDILTKVDRAAMFVSLETRVPFLDHRVVEFAWQLPLAYKLRDGQSKWILRQVLYRYVPRALIERPKMGFGVPIGDWLRGPLRDWAEELLDESQLRQQGYFHPQLIRLKWAEHLSGKRNWQYLLWDVLMFQAWLAKNS
ncbi:asparagine synthase (glutamine-hydrolyzing) [Pseudomonas sp. JBR1]|uniref:asparagine synthase (glutamine-hydrolyzing) n=1 Tax=Pseudomonas sp. JBR1 TaxID=3020907 RepID=UPI0023056355|nr:asparagine synthase (glutamine-hydrolyzing) [Pseudomonas sp. JBR1]WCE07570.1 asparagine synthase (glutamine-hydrolyzing) [Pseudomonas sp. JBR1]